MRCARMLVAIVVAVTVLCASTSDTIAAPATSAAPAPTGGWFVQVSSLAPTYSVATVTGWLAPACKLPADQRPSLVLQDIVDAKGGLATTYLDAIAPYLPGGPLHCFSRVFVGTSQPVWNGPGSPYDEGVRDAAFRTRYVAQAAQLGRQFVQRYPRVTVDWYLAYEANVNALYYPAIASGYADLLHRLEVVLDGVRSGRSFMWSPAFWYPWHAYHGNAAGMAGLRTQLSRLFADLGSLKHPLIVNLQDFVGGSSCQPASNQMTPADAVAWALFLSSLPGAPTVTLNVEQFRFDCATGGIIAASADELASRRATYVAAGVPLGPAFEIRYSPPAGNASALSRQPQIAR